LGIPADSTRAETALRTPSGELAGVAVFAAGTAPESGDLCGPEPPSSGRPSRPAKRSQGSPGRGAALHTPQAKLCRGDALSRARSTQRGHAVSITAPAKCGVRAPACGAPWERSLRAEQERHGATVADAEADQMRRQFLKIAMRQIRDDPRESFERRQPADVAESDIGNQRMLVTAMIERRDLESGAAQFK
jgi:hypothetical protein